MVDITLQYTPQRGKRPPLARFRPLPEWILRVTVTAAAAYSGQLRTARCGLNARGHIMRNNEPRQYLVLVGLLGLLLAGASPAAESLIAPIEAAIRAKLGRYLYGADADRLATVTAARLRERDLSLAVVETVTDGLIAQGLAEAGAAIAARAFSSWNPYKSRMTRTISRRSAIRSVDLGRGQELSLFGLP